MRLELRRLWLVLLVLVAATCVADTVSERMVAPGVSYAALRREAGPWEIRVLRVARDEKRVRLETALAQGTVKGVETLSATIKRETQPEDYVVAAVNADFFVMAGNPLAGTLCGLTLRRGELVMTARNRPAAVLMADGTPRIGTFNTSGSLQTPGGTISVGGVNQEPPKDSVSVFTARYGWAQTLPCVVLKCEGLPLTPTGQWKATVLETPVAGSNREVAEGELILRAAGTAQDALSRLKPGDAVTLKLDTPDLPAGASEAVGGSTVLVRDGRVLPDPKGTDPRHPRTAFGYNSREIFLVTVDGRQTGWSVGMRMGELASLMAELGCTDAVNLDGGGSTTAWVRGEVMNRPSDGGQRRIADSLLVRSRVPVGPAVRLTVDHERITALPGAKVPIRYWLTDEGYNPVKMDPARMSLEIVPQSSGVSASLADGVITIGPGTGSATLRLHYRGEHHVVARVPLVVLPACSRLEVEPPTAELCTGESVRFSAQGVTAEGEQVWVPQELVQWQAAGNALRTSDSGTFTALRGGMTATVTARLGEATGTGTMRIAQEVAVEDFEGTPPVRFSAYPEKGSVTGKVELQKGDAAVGQGYCRMTYDLGKPEGTRAAYVMLDKPIPGALKLSLSARASGPAKTWLRAAVVDGNGTRQLFSFSEALAPAKTWRQLSVRLPEGIKQPATWQSVYVVATGGDTGSGSVDVDDLRILSSGDGH